MTSYCTVHKCRKTLINLLLTVPLTLIIALQLQGCPAVIFGAAGGTALAVHDRRDSETIIQDQKIESTVTNKQVKY
jgi:hypothetical protein